MQKLLLIIFLLLSLAACSPENSGGFKRANSCAKLYQQQSSEAMIACKREAMQNNAESQYLLARLYLQKLAKGSVDEAGCGNDDDLNAIFWLKKSAKNGYSKAQTYLGSIYLYPDTEFFPYIYFMVDSSPKTGVAWLTKGAESGDTEGQYTLCRYYAFGPYVEAFYNDEAPRIDHNKALYWCTQAAAQGNTKAKVLLKKLKEPQIKDDLNLQESD